MGVRERRILCVQIPCYMMGNLGQVECMDRWLGFWCKGRVEHYGLFMS